MKRTRKQKRAHRAKRERRRQRRRAQLQPFDRWRLTRHARFALAMQSALEDLARMYLAAERQREIEIEFVIGP